MKMHLSNVSCAAVKARWPRSLPGANLLGLTLTLLSIMGCASNGARVPDAPPTSRCNVPQNLLEPIPQPPLRDATNKDLIAENDEVRAALDSANGDKQRIKTYLNQRCN